MPSLAKTPNKRPYKTRTSNPKGGEQTRKATISWEHQPQYDAESDPVILSKHLKGMEGQGYYNRNSLPQGAGNLQGLEAWQRAVNAVVNEGSHANFIHAHLENIHIADYGSSQGKNSIAIMKAALNRIPHGASVVVTHVDLPTNDFNSLIQITADPVEGYASDEHHEVYVASRGISFYKKAFPQATVHLGWCAFATHWLSEVPDAPLNHFVIHKATNPERAMWVERARQDWRMFVYHRAEELVSNGHFVQVGIARDENGITGNEGIWDLMKECLEAVLPAATYKSLRIPAYCRSVTEWLEPFQEHPKTWRMVHVGHRVAVNPFWAEYQDDGDLEKFVEGITGCVRAAYMAGLVRDAMIDLGDFYDRFKAGLRANPALGKLDWRLVVLDVERI